MDAIGLLMHGFAVLLTWKTLLLVMIGLVLGIFVGVCPASAAPTAWRSCAADVHDGLDLGNRDAVLHLLGRAVRRRHHLILFNIFQHPCESLVGRDHLRRLSDGATGQGG